MLRQSSGYRSKRREFRDLKRDLHTQIHSTVIHNSQKVETPQLSMNR